MLLVPAFSCRLVCSTGAIPAMRGSSSSLIASASLTVTVGPTGPRMRPPRPPPNEVVTVSRLVPRSVRLLVISRCTPAPTEVSVTTEETPMMIPRVVRIERMMFALMLRQARVNTSKAPRPARRDPFARSTALVVGLPRRALLIATRPNGRKLRLLPLVGLDQAVAQLDDPLRLLGDLRFVGDYYDRRALAVQLVEEPHYLLAGTGVEVAGRFVGEEQRRVHGEGAGDGYPLPLAAGELCGGVAVFLGQSHLLEELHRPGATLAPAHPGVHERHLDILEDGEAGQQVERLEHETDVVVAGEGALVLAQVAHFLAAQQVLPLAVAVEQAQDVHQCALAAAAWPDERDHLALVDVEGDARQRPELVVAQRVELADVAQGEDAGHQNPDGPPKVTETPRRLPSCSPPAWPTTISSPSSNSPVTTVVKPTLSTIRTGSSCSSPARTIVSDGLGPRCTASLGTETVSSNRATSICASAVIPGRTERSGFSIVTVTSKMGMLFSSRATGEMAVTEPGNSSSGLASSRTVAAWPTATEPISVSST